LSAYLPVLAYLGIWLLFGVGVGLLRRALAGAPPQAATVAPTALPDDTEAGEQWLSLAWMAPVVFGAGLLLLLWASRLPADDDGAALLPAFVILLVTAIVLFHVHRRGALPGTADGA
jgi:hypothetical protein